MIREEYLGRAATVNLILTRNLRDVSVLTLAGFRTGDFSHAYAYERLRLYLELLMRDTAATAAGLVKQSPAIVSDYTAEAEHKTAEQTGLALSADITPTVVRALSRSLPPVGKLPGLYEKTKETARKGLQLAQALSERIAVLYDGAACRKMLHALPLSGMEAFGAMTAQAVEAFEILLNDKTDALAADSSVLSALTACLADAFDPIYEADIRSALSSGAPDCRQKAAAAAVKGAKCVQPPLFADLILRYSSI